MICSLASLNKENIEQIQSLERKIGKTLLAFSCKEMKIDALKDDEITQIREVESRLGLSLVAIK